MTAAGDGPGAIGAALREAVEGSLSHLRGARLADADWERLEPALERLRRAVAAGDAPALVRARDELAALGPQRRAALGSEPDPAASSGPRPIPEHVNKLITGIWFDLTGSAPPGWEAGAPGREA